MVAAIAHLGEVLGSNGPQRASIPPWRGDLLGQFAADVGRTLSYVYQTPQSSLSFGSSLSQMLMSHDDKWHGLRGSGSRTPEFFRAGDERLLQPWSPLSCLVPQLNVLEPSWQVKEMSLSLFARMVLLYLQSYLWPESPDGAIWGTAFGLWLPLPSSWQGHPGANRNFTDHSKSFWRERIFLAAVCFGTHGDLSVVISV